MNVSAPHTAATNASIGSSRHGYFVIADLSGYTRFVTENDLEHAQGVLHDLISLIIEQLGSPLEFVELEGDAVFVYAREEAVVNPERLLDLMEACYAAFRLRVEQMTRNTTCPCTACRSIPMLDLKCVAHHGRFVVQQTPKGPQLVGPDVVLVHRLLKNSVIETTGIQAYALLTETFVARAYPPAEVVSSVEQVRADSTSASAAPPTPGGAGGREAQADAAAPSTAQTTALDLPLHLEEVERFGAVRTRVLDLAACVERHRARFRENLDACPIDLEIVTTVPAPARFVWGYITDPVLRLRWQTDIRGVRSTPAGNGRTDVGSSSHCDHGGYVMEHRIVDWQPFTRITKHSQSTGSSLTKPPPCQADFFFEDRPDGTCVLRFAVRLRHVGLFTRLLFKAVKPLVRREWEGHFRLLQKAVAGDLAAQAALMSQSPAPG